MKAAEGIGSRVSSTAEVGTAIWHAGQMVGGARGRGGGSSDHG